MWNKVLSLTAQQHGLVTRAQLIEIGWSRGQIDGHVRRGRLERVDHGVYRLAGAPATPLTEPMAAVLRSGADARVAGERLLAACGVRDADPHGPFVVLVPTGRRLRRATHAWRPDRHAAAGVAACVQGVPSFSIPRNLAEAAVDTVADAHVAVLADGVRRVARRHMAAVERLLISHPDHPGARRLLRLGCLDVDAAESRPERLLEVLLADFSPRRQVVLGRDRVDFLLPSLRVVVEYDGSDHESGRAREDDAARDARLRTLGYSVVRVTRLDMRRPDKVLARIQDAAAR